MSNKKDIAITTETLVGEFSKVFWQLTASRDQGYRVTVLQGGTSSGKTYAAMQYILLQCITKPNYLVTVVASSYPILRVGALQDAQTIVSNSIHISQFIKQFNKSTNTYFFNNGSKLEFRSLDSGEHAKAGKRSLLFVNEITSVPEEIVNELLIRSNDGAIFDYNPTAQFYVHTNFVPREDTQLLISTYRDNQFVSQAVVDEIEKLRTTNPNRYRVYGLGLTGATDDVIYSNIEWIFPEKFPEPSLFDKYAFALDYGFSKDPTAILECGIYNNKLFARLHTYSKNLKLQDIVDEFKRIGISRRDEIIMDYSHAQEQKVILERQYGYNIIKARRGRGDIVSGISLLQEQSLVLCDDKDKNLLKETRNYTWKKRGGIVTDKPVDDYNHALDALRYYALEKLGKPSLGKYKYNDNPIFTF